MCSNFNNLNYAQVQIEKQLLIGGLDWSWSEGVPSYPATTHTLKYIIKKGTGTTYTLTSAADGDLHKFTIDDDDTANYPAGWYTYTALVQGIADADVLIAVAKGVVQIHKDLSTVSDARVFALNMVDNLRTAITELSTKTMSDVSIEGHSYTYNDLEKLQKMLSYYERASGVKKKKRHLFQPTIS